MSKEDLDMRTVDDFIADNEEDFRDFLIEEFDSDETRRKYAVSRRNKYLEYKSKREEDAFDRTAEIPEWDKYKH